MVQMDLCTLVWQTVEIHAFIIYQLIVLSPQNGDIIYRKRKIGVMGITNIIFDYFVIGIRFVSTAVEGDNQMALARDYLR